MSGIEGQPLDAFLADLGSKASTPGGGSAASVLGAIGAALAGMVANLTLGKKKYAAVKADMQALVERAESLRVELVEAIAEDVDAFDTVMRAYGLPKASDAEKASRDAAIQSALAEAAKAPLACARLCREAIGLARVATDKGSEQMVSDAGVAALAALAGLRASALNVLVNTRALTDAGTSDRLRGELDGIMGGAEAEAEAIYREVHGRLA